MAQPELVYVCEICQTILHEHHCKAVCPNCGRMFDCSDLAAMHANARFDTESGAMTIRPGSDPRDWLPNAGNADEVSSSGEAEDPNANLP